MPTPKVLRTKKQLRQALSSLRRDGRPIVFVPTMGDLHRGHLSLVEAGTRLGSVVVSVFVNPTQFGPDEDYDAYPRNLQHDLDLLSKVEGVAAVFAPDAEVMYGSKDSTYVEVKGVSEPLEGKYRPGHLRGVATVVAKLFLLVNPQAAVFGQKDAQQCILVYRMVEDLHFPLRLVFVPTVREDDGLAMSSRNRYLDRAQREKAGCLYRALQAGRSLLVSGERRAEAIEREMIEVLLKEDCRPDYAALRETQTLGRVEEARGRVLLAVAGHVGAARLIDNLCLDVEDGSVKDAPLRDDAVVEAVEAALKRGGESG